MAWLASYFAVYCLKVKIESPETPAGRPLLPPSSPLPTAPLKVQCWLLLPRPLRWSPTMRFPQRARGLCSAPRWGPRKGVALSGPLPGWGLQRRSCLPAWRSGWGGQKRWRPPPPRAWSAWPGHTPNSGATTASRPAVSQLPFSPPCLDPSLLTGLVGVQGCP
jgi:hypothetical protein